MPHAYPYPSQQQGLSLRFITAVDMLLKTAAALLSLKKSSSPFSIHFPSVLPAPAFPGRTLTSTPKFDVAPGFLLAQGEP